jgi:hypothetical protein
MDGLEVHADDCPVRGPEIVAESEALKEENAKLRVEVESRRCLAHKAAEPVASCLQCVLLQVDGLHKALEHIIGFYGPGLDGSPEEVAGKLAREAIEQFVEKTKCEECKTAPASVGPYCRDCLHVREKLVEEPQKNEVDRLNALVNELFMRPCKVHPFLALPEDNCQCDPCKVRETIRSRGGA